MLRYVGESLYLGRFMRVLWCKIRVFGVLVVLVGKYPDVVVLGVIFPLGCYWVWVKLGACVRHFGGVGVVGWGEERFTK